MLTDVPEEVRVVCVPLRLVQELPEAVDLHQTAHPQHALDNTSLVGVRGGLHNPKIKCDAMSCLGTVQMAHPRNIL